MARLCPACGSIGEKKYSENIDPKKISAKTFSSRKTPELMHHCLFECQSCRSLYSENLPQEEELLKGYEDALFDSKTEANFAALTYVNYLNNFESLENQRVLDIGCGDGAFLEKVLSFGAKTVQGIEPSYLAAKSEQQLEVPIKIQPIENCQFVEEFDLVTCFQTLEHVRDPSKVLAIMFSAIVDGGYLAIISHDRFSIVNRILGRKSPIFDIEHLQIFSKKGLENLMRRNRVKIVLSCRIINRYPISYWLRSLPLPVSILRIVEKNKEKFVLNIPVSLGVGNHLVIGQKLASD